MTVPKDVDIIRCTECHQILVISNGQMIIDHPRLDGELVRITIRCICGLTVNFDVPSKFQEGMSGDNED